MTDIPETLEQEATRLTSKWLGSPVSCEAIYKDLIAIALSERRKQIERDAKIAEHLNGWGPDRGQGGHAEHIARIIRAQQRPK